MIYKFILDERQRRNKVLKPTWSMVRYISIIIKITINIKEIAWHANVKHSVSASLHCFL